MNKLEKIFNFIIRNNKISIGRLLLFSTFFLAMIKWACNVEIQPSQLTVLLALLAYVLGSKFMITNNNKKDDEIKK